MLRLLAALLFLFAVAHPARAEGCGADKFHGAVVESPTPVYGGDLGMIVDCQFDAFVNFPTTAAVLRFRIEPRRCLSDIALVPSALPRVDTQNVSVRFFDRLGQPIPGSDVDTTITIQDRMRSDIPFPEVCGVRGVEMTLSNSASWIGLYEIAAE